MIAFVIVSVKKCKPRAFGGKNYLTIFWDSYGLVFFDFLKEYETLNAKYFIIL